MTSAVASQNCILIPLLCPPTYFYNLQSDILKKKTCYSKVLGQFWSSQCLQHKIKSNFGQENSPFPN